MRKMSKTLAHMNEKENFSMNKDGRLTDIMNILEKRQSATVEYLSKKIYTSPSTIRRDLNVLESQGYVRRFHGGVAITNYPTASLPIEYRIQDMAAAKKRIGHTAARLVENGDTIFIDSSSTAAAIIPHLETYHGLKVVTNSMLSLHQLQELDVEVYGIGGQLFHTSNAFVGQFALDMLSHFHINKMFFSTASLSQSGTLCNNTESENHVRLYALNRSEKAYFMVDSSKIGVSSMLHLCHLRDLTGVISDAALPEIIPWEDNYPAFYPAE